MNKFINLDVMRNPANWVTIGVMIAFVLVAGFVIYSRLAPADVPAGNLQAES